MSENTIFVKNYHNEDEPLKTVNKKEVWRYAGYIKAAGGNENDTDAELLKIYDAAVAEATKTLAYKVCYRRMEVSWNQETGMPILPFETDSKDLAKCLEGCDEIVMFAATIGMGLDRLIVRNQKFALTKTLIFQAFGAERVEALCDAFCNDMKLEAEREGRCVTPRFSPGYGDLNISVQRDFFNLLDCNRKVGISLNESLLMTPSKSVTAIFGVKNR